MANIYIYTFSYPSYVYTYTYDGYENRTQWESFQQAISRAAQFTRPSSFRIILCRRCNQGIKSLLFSVVTALII